MKVFICYYFFEMHSPYLFNLTILQSNKELIINLIVLQSNNE